MKHHTPGPWIIEENASHYPFVMAEDNNVVAALFENDGSLYYGRSHEETIANTKLIAAAPDLLEALDYVQKVISNIDAWWIDIPDKGGFDISIIKSAIKKATI